MTRAEHHAQRTLVIASLLSGVRDPRTPRPVVNEHDRVRTRAIAR